MHSPVLSSIFLGALAGLVSANTAFNNIASGQPFHLCSAFDQTFCLTTANTAPFAFQNTWLTSMKVLQNTVAQPNAFINIQNATVYGAFQGFTSLYDVTAKGYIRTVNSYIVDDFNAPDVLGTFGPAQDYAVRVDVGTLDTTVKLYMPVNGGSYFGFDQTGAAIIIAASTGYAPEWYVVPIYPIVYSGVNGAATATTTQLPQTA